MSTLNQTLDLYFGRKLAGRMDFAGLPISIEYAKGDVRKGKGWQRTMNAHYGYIRSTKGNDNEAIDVYIGPLKASKKVFIIHQLDFNGKYDEDKVMLGYPTASSAKSSYLQHVPSQLFGSIDEMSMQEFKLSLPSMKKKIKASVGPITPDTPIMTIFEVLPTFVPPSSKEKPIPVPDSRETDDRFLDVTQREDAQTQKFRMDLLQHRPRPIHKTMAIVPGRQGSTAAGGTLPYMSFSNKGEELLEHVRSIMASKPRKKGK